MSTIASLSFIHHNFYIELKIIYLFEDIIFIKIMQYYKVKLKYKISK